MSAPQHDLFISYAHTDDEDGWVTGFVESLQSEHARFTPQPLAIFFDRDEIRTGDDWAHRILAGLKSSKLMLAILSPAYFASEYCRLEWETYLRHELDRAVPGEGIKPVYTITVPEFDAQDAAAELDQWLTDLKRRQYLDVRPWRPQGRNALRQGEVRQRLELLDQQISERIVRVEQSRVSPTTIPEHNRNFVGRIDELRQLKEMLLFGQVGAIAALQGLGGIGKSALAFEYAHAFAADYPGGRFLISAAGASDLRTSIIQLAPYKGIELSAAERDDMEMAFLKVKHAFEQGPRCLLLLDNVDDPSLLTLESRRRMLPTGENVHLLVTTRMDSQQLGNLHCLSLDHLPEQDALKLLELHRRPSDEAQRKAAVRIGRSLDGYPLALELVGVYLWMNQDVSYVDYQHRLESEGLLALEGAAADDLVQLSRNPQKFIRPLLAPTLGQLTSPETLALQYASLLPADRIPLRWLRELVGAEFPATTTKPPPGHPDPWVRITRRLEGMRLLIPGDETATARMHRLVQEVVRADIGQESVPPRRATLRRLLRRMLPAVFSRGGKAQRQELDDELTEFAWSRIEAIHSDGLDPEETWEAPVLRDYCRQLLVSQHVDACFMAHETSRVLSRAGRYGEDRQLLAEAIKIWEESDSGDEIALATAHASLGTMEARLGNFEQARQLYLLALETFDQQDSPEAAGIYSSLATVEGHLGNRKAAAQWRRKTVDLKSSSVRSGDLPSANLDSALLARDEGDLRLAREQMLQVLALQEETLAADDPGLADTYANLSGVELDLRNYEAAHKWAQRSMEISLARLPEDHPLLVFDFCALGAIELNLRRFVEARENLDRALSIVTKHFPEGHFCRATCLKNLAQVESLVGNGETARELYMQAVADYQRFFPDGHPQWTASLLELSLLERKLGNRPAARTAAQQCLVALERSDGALPLAVANVLNQLGVVELEMGNAQVSIQHLQKALAIQHQNLPDGHLLLATTRFNLSHALQNLGNLPAACQAMEAAFVARKDKLGMQHEATQACVRWLSQFHPAARQGLARQQGTPSVVAPTPVENAESSKPDSAPNAQASQQSVDEIRTEIRAKVQRIREQVVAGPPLGEFCAVLLSNTVSSLAAYAGAVWLRRAGEPFTKIAEHFATRQIPAVWSQLNAGSPVFEKVIKSGNPATLIPSTILAPSPKEHSEDAKDATLLILCPLPAQSDVRGLLVVCQRGDTPADVQKGYARFTAQMASLAGEYLKRHGGN